MMSDLTDMQFDTIGFWSELKLEILSEYGSAYSTILRNNKNKLSYGYIDGFSGEGYHYSETTGNLVEGSPIIPLNLKHPFPEIHLVEKDAKKVRQLRKLVGGNKNAIIYEGDANEILLNQIFPKFQYQDYRRALCLLDPYGLHLDWRVIEASGKSRTMDVFINFPVMDINRNCIWDQPEKVSPHHIERMNKYWGDDSWKNLAFRKRESLFGEEIESRTPGASAKIVNGFRDKLKKQAKFEYVPEPLAMRNRSNAIVYYLFFGSQNKAADKITKHLFQKYKERRG